MQLFLLAVLGGLVAFSKKAQGAVLSALGIPASYGPQQPAQSTQDLLTLARTIWGEARGEGWQGMAAVAGVIMNRVKRPEWPGSVYAVCTQRLQFSAWNTNDPNYKKIQGLDLNSTDPEWRTALDIANRALNGTLGDITLGADHYYNPSVASPDWADPYAVTAQIGNHVFLKLT